MTRQVFPSIIQWNGVRRRSLKVALFVWHGSVVRLGWFSVHCICEISYFSLDARGSLWGSLPLRLCGHTRWQRAVSAGCIILRDDAAWGGTRVQSEIRLPNGRNESLFRHSSGCVAYQGLYLLWISSWSQMVTFLTTGNGFITLPERNRSTKQWLCTSNYCVCRRERTPNPAVVNMQSSGVEISVLSGCACSLLVVIDWLPAVCLFLTALVLVPTGTQLPIPRWPGVTSGVLPCLGVWQWLWHVSKQRVSRRS